MSIRILLTAEEEREQLRQERIDNRTRRIVEALAAEGFGQSTPSEVSQRLAIAKVLVRIIEGDKFGF